MCHTIQPLKVSTRDFSWGKVGRYVWLTTYHPCSAETSRISGAWCFSDRASWIDYTLITNLMHWLLFIHKILFSSTCFEPQVFIFRRIQLYTCSIWYCHSSWWPVGTQLEWELKMSTWGSKHVEENYRGLFISPSGTSELYCATTKTDTAERSISIGRESLKVFFCTRGLGVLAGSTARG